MAADLTSLVSRLENVAIKLEKAVNKNQQLSPNEGGGDVLAPLVLAYDELIQGPFKSFHSLGAKLGNEVLILADMVETAVRAQRQFLITVSKCRQPTENVLMSLLKPTSDQIQAIQEFRQKNRASAYFNHLSAVSESIPALGWVAVAPTPAPYVKEMLDAGQFYTNRVLMDYKDKDKIHVDWARNWLQFLNELQAYVKKYHLTGLTWNSSGCDVEETSTGFFPTSSCPPPPPPPPPPPEASVLTGGGQSMEDSRAALFREINQGENITKGLRNITSDQQTHKNPELRLQTTTPYKNPPITARPFKPPGSGTAMAPPKRVKPPRTELEGKKWVVVSNATKVLEHMINW